MAPPPSEPGSDRGLRHSEAAGRADSVIPGVARTPARPDAATAIAGGARLDLWFLVVLAGAVAIRALGITHDLPFSFMGDEAHFVKRAVAFGSGDLNPHWFHKPAGYMYLLFFEYGLFYLIGRVLGAFPNLDAFISLFVNDRSAFYLIGRATTLLFGVGMVAMTYLIGRRVFGRGAGLLAAGLLALCPAHVLGSQVVKADVPAGFFVVLALWLLLPAVEDPRRVKPFLLAGLAAGIGMGVKYYSVPLLPVFFLACWDPARPFLRRVWGMAVNWRPWAAVAMFTVAFFAVSPYDFIDPAGAIRHRIVARAEQAVVPQEAYDPDHQTKYTTGIATVVPAAAQFMGVVFNPKGAGPVHALLAVIGMAALGVRRPDRRARMLVWYAFLFMLTASLMAPFHTSPRHLAPLYPVLFLFEAAVLVGLFRRLPARLSSGTAKVAPWVVVALLVAPSVYADVSTGLRNTREDTRNLAKTWIEANIPAGSRILLDEDGPVLRNSRQNLERMRAVAQALGPGPFTTHAGTYYEHLAHYQRGITYDLTEISHPWWLPASEGEGAQRLTDRADADMGNPVKKRGVDPLDTYLAEGVRYVVLNDARSDLYLDTPRGDRYPEFRSFYRDVMRRGRVIAEFDPMNGDRPGPRVTVYAF